MANSIAAGITNTNSGEYTNPNQCMAIRNTTKVSTKLKSSLMASDSGKKIVGTLIDLIMPLEFMILFTD